MKRVGYGSPAILPDVLAANEKYARRRGAVSPSKLPRLRTLVLTCMDARIDPLPLLGLGEGEVHVLRNAGGRVTSDAIRSIVISQRLLGTRDILVVHHADCGLIGATNDSLRACIRRKGAVDVDRIDFRPIADLGSSLRADIAALRRSKLIRDDSRIAGLIYDVRNGRLLPEPRTELIARRRPTPSQRIRRGRP